MRVTHVITRLIVGGAQENTVATVLGVARRGEFEVDLISGPTSGPEGTLEPLLAGTKLLDVCPHLTRPVNAWRDGLAYLWLVRRFRSKRPDIVHTHSGKAGILGRLAAARVGAPIVIHTIHGPSFGRFQGSISNFVFRGAERIAGRRTTHFVAVANAMTDQYLAAGIGRGEQDPRIFSGFEIEPFAEARNDPELRERLGIRRDDLVVGKIARLFEHKGHDDLLAASSRLKFDHPNLRLLLVGDGAWRSRLTEKVRALGLGDRVVFAGLVSPEEVCRYVGIMDVLVHLSAREGLPRALPQAMAAGKPVAAYDCDGAKEACLDGETGFLIRPGDLEMLTVRLRELLCHPELRLTMGQAGRKLARENFSVERMVEELNRLYSESVAGRERRQG